MKLKYFSAIDNFYEDSGLDTGVRQDVAILIRFCAKFVLFCIKYKNLCSFGSCDTRRLFVWLVYIHWRAGQGKPISKHVNQNFVGITWSVGASSVTFGVWALTRLSYHKLFFRLKVGEFFYGKKRIQFN